MEEINVEELAIPKFIDVQPANVEYGLRINDNINNREIDKPLDLGDYDNSYLSQPKPSVEPNYQIMSINDIREQQYKQAKSIESKTFSEQWTPFWNQASRDNLGAAVVEWGATKWYTEFKDDANFKIDDEIVFATLNANKLDFKSFSALRDTKSQDEFNFMLTRQLTRAREDKEIEESLGAKTRMSASIIGMIGDVDMVGGLAISKFYKTEKLMRLAAAETSYEVSLAAARMNFNEDYSMSDFLIDVSLGFAVNMGAAKVLGHMQTNRVDVQADDTSLPETPVLSKVNEDGVVEISLSGRTLDVIEAGKAKNRKVVTEAERQRILEQEQIPDTKEYVARIDKEKEVRARVYRDMGFSEVEIKKKIDVDFETKEVKTWLEEYREAQSNRDTKIADIDRKIKELDEKFPEEVAKSKEAQLMYDSLSEKIQKIFKDRRQAEADAERLEEVEVEVAARQREEVIIREDQRRQNEILANKFKDKKYEKSNLNRKDFYEHQRKLESDKVSPIINEIELNMGRVTSALNKARKELAKLLKEGGTKLKIDNRKKKIKDLQTELDSNKAQIKDLAPKVGVIADDMKYTMRVVDDMMENVVDSATRLLDELKNTRNGEIDKNLISVIDEFYKRNPNIAKEIKDLLGSKLGNKVIKKDIKAKDIKARATMSKKMKALILAAAFSGVTVSADEDGLSTEGFLFVGFVAAVLLGAGGLAQIAKFIKNPEVIAPIKRFTDSMQTNYKKSAKNVSPEASKMRHYATWLADISHTRLSSAVAPLLKEGGNVAEFTKKLFFSHSGGDGLAFLADGWRHSSMSSYYIAERAQYDNWLIERGVKGFTNKITQESDLLVEFRQLVSTNMRKRNSTSKAIQKMTDEQDTIYQSEWSRAKEYGVKGFEDIDYEKGKTPRLWKTSAIYDMLHGADDASVKSFTNAIHQGVLASLGGDEKKAKGIAESLVKHFKTRVTATDDRTENIYDLVESLLKDKVTEKDFSDAMSTIVDASGRARNRVPLDIDAIPNFEMNINGKSQTINMSMILENDSHALLKMFSNEMSGLSALAKGGFPTVQGAMTFIEKNFPPHLQRRGEALTDMLLGRAIRGSERGDVNDVISSLKDITIAEKLPFVIFSVPYELFKTITNGGYAKSIKNLLRVSSKSMTKNEVERLAQLMENTSSGTSVMRSKGNMSGNTIDTPEGTIDTVGNMRSVTNKVASTAMLYNGLSAFTDTMQKVNLLRNEEKLAKYISTGEGITKGRADTYNIKESDFDRFKDDFKFESNGELKPIDQTGWSITKKDDYANILRKMGMEQVIEHTSGESPLWASMTTAGKLLHTLVGYPMMLHNIHFQNGMRQLDRTFLADNILAFGGSYLGYQLKYAVLDKEVDDEQIAMYALMNTLPLSLLSSITSMSNSPVLQVTQTATNLISPVEWSR